MVPAASTEQGASALGGAHFTPAEADSRGDEGGGPAAPADRPSWFRRSREAFQGSVWAPVALKLAGVALGMIALSGVGVVSILSGAGGVQVPLAGMLGSDIHGAWLANKPAASARPNLTALAAPSAGASAATAEEPKKSATGAATAAPAAPSSGMTADGKVILNLASIEDLRHLPGVGQKRADAIVALRARLGHFKHVNDLLRVKGIGVRGLKKILPHVVLDAPPVGAGTSGSTAPHA